MKLSKYATEIEIDNINTMLYSTLSRKYYVYNKADSEQIKAFIADINKGVYTEKEIEIFKNLLNASIIIQDELDEQKKLEVLENAARYQENTYKVMILATNACNFRCTYCEQEHVTKRLGPDTKDKILRLIEIQAQKNKRIEIDWFGGEPLLEYDSICDMLEKADELCQRHSSELFATFTTNGYLLDSNKIKNLKRLNTRSMQITLDGNQICHDKRRVLINGQGTFAVVLKNIIEVVKEGIVVTLRINIDEENANDISEIVDGIPEEYRSRVCISICNLFQNRERISTFDLYKQAISKGYIYSQRKNHYVGCHTGMLNATVINTDGSVLVCANGISDEKRMGFIGNNGNICVERSADLYKLQTVTARDNPECRECIELPYCIASCKYERAKNNSKCLGKSGDGLSLREKALLDYYSDLQKKQGGISNE